MAISGRRTLLSQVVIVHKTSGKICLCVDYTQKLKIDGNMETDTSGITVEINIINKLQETEFHQHAGCISLLHVDEALQAVHNSNVISI